MATSLQAELTEVNLYFTIVFYMQQREKKMVAYCCLSGVMQGSGLFMCVGEEKWHLRIHQNHQTMSMRAVCRHQTLIS